eukprot:scaffold2930_cov376-Prasinococcus_capsulatus_cf.AAC.12
MELWGGEAGGEALRLGHGVVELHVNDVVAAQLDELIQPRVGGPPVVHVQLEPHVALRVGRRRQAPHPLDGVHEVVRRAPPVAEAPQELQPQPQAVLAQHRHHLLQAARSEAEVLAEGRALRERPRQDVHRAALVARRGAELRLRGELRQPSRKSGLVRLVRELDREAEGARPYAVLVQQLPHARRAVLLEVVHIQVDRVETVPRRQLQGRLEGHLLADAADVRVGHCPVAVAHVQRLLHAVHHLGDRTRQLWRLAAVAMLVVGAASGQRGPTSRRAR